MQSPHIPFAGKSDADEQYLVRDPVRVRALLQALIDQRAILGAHPDGRAPSFPSAVLELGEDTLLLDGSPRPAVNRRAADARFLLCVAQVDRVTVRFRAERPRPQEQDGYVAFRAALPEALYHLQRRGLYRLETPVGDSPWCRLPDPDGGDPLRLRAADISAGGMAVLLPADQQVLELQQRWAGCVLELPGSTEIPVDLVVRSLVAQRRADGTEQQRVGLSFEDLPRGAEAAIQRYVFRIDRERRARLSGNA